VEHLLRDVASTSSAPSSSLLTTQSLSTRVAAQLTALEGLSARLTEIVDYLVAVQQKKLTVNHQIIYHVQEILGLLPQLGGNVEVGQAFRVGGNDSGLVTYLSSMIRTVLALHDLSECRLWGRVEGRKLIRSREQDCECAAGAGRQQDARGEEGGRGGQGCCGGEEGRGEEGRGEEGGGEEMM